MPKTWTITEIKQANRAAGNHYFEPATMRFFDSRVERRVYSGNGGVYFVTSEQFHGSQGTAPRRWTVRQFHPETGDIDTCGEFNVMDRETAMDTARKLAKG